MNDRRASPNFRHKIKGDMCGLMMKDLCSSSFAVVNIFKRCCIFGRNGNDRNPVQGFHRSLFVSRCYNSNSEAKRTRSQRGECRCAAQPGTVLCEILCDVTYHEII